MTRIGRRLFTGATFTLAIALSPNAIAQTSDEQSETLGPVLPFAVEGYYKIKWGHYEEFLELFKKNHWPVLQEGIEMGAILEVVAESPRFHASEDNRWDLRITIVWRNPTVAMSRGSEATEAILRRLFPDREAFERAERRRFELIEAHTDVPVFTHDTASW